MGIRKPIHLMVADELIHQATTTSFANLGQTSNLAHDQTIWVWAQTVRAPADDPVLYDEPPRIGLAILYSSQGYLTCLEHLTIHSDSPSILGRPYFTPDGPHFTSDRPCSTLDCRRARRTWCRLLHAILLPATATLPPPYGLARS